jgi:phage tail P2-like protein
MTRPVVHDTTEQTYRLLPDYVRNADEATDFTLLRYMAGLSIGLTKAGEFLTIADPETSVTGTCEVANPAAAPRNYLTWLGWLVGIDTTVLADSVVRETLANVIDVQRRGSINAIKLVVARTLISSKYVAVYWNRTGTDPYLLTVVVKASEVTSTPTTLAAAWSEKPAGMNLELDQIPNSTWNEVVANYATWNDLVAAHPTWDELSTWVAP